MRIALAALLLGGMAVSAGAAPTPAARALGLVVRADESTPPLLIARLADTLMESLAAARTWEATVLTEESALVKAAGATWPPMPAEALPPVADLRTLVTALRLDDLVAVRLTTKGGNEAEVVWVRPEVAVAKGFRATVTGGGEAAVTQLARQLAARLEEGFAKAPDLVPAAPETPAPAPAPETPAPAPAPETPAPAPAPAEPAAEPRPAEGPAEPPPADAPLSAHYAAAEQFIREGDLRKAEDSAQLAAEAGDPRAQVCLLRARIQAAKGNSEEERLWLERALTADATLAEARLRLAELLRQKGLWRKALEEYEAVLGANPKNLHALLGMAVIYSQHDQPRRAAEIVAQAAQLYPEDASLHLRLGDLHAQRNALAEAEQAYDQAARLAQTPEAKASAFDRLGDLYIGAQRYREGFACYAEASKLRGGSSSPLAEKRYEQVMSAADEGLRRGLARIAQALEGYLADDGAIREEVYAALGDLRAEATEVSGFLDVVAPPASLKLPHARRKLAYSLVLETVVIAMTYLDTGDAALLNLYRNRFDEARRDLEGLGAAGPG